MSSATRLRDETSGLCDVGAECCPHDRSGVNISGSANVYINGRAAHRLNDAGDCRCPHGGTYLSTAASSTVFANGRGITRIGDATTCTNCGCGGQHVTGSPNVFIG